MYCFRLLWSLTLEELFRGLPPCTLLKKQIPMGAIPKIATYSNKNLGKGLRWPT